MRIWKMKWNSVKVKETIDQSISNKVFLGTELPLHPQLLHSLHHLQISPNLFFCCFQVIMQIRLNYRNNFMAHNSKQITRFPQAMNTKQKIEVPSETFSTGLACSYW